MSEYADPVVYPGWGEMLHERDALREHMRMLTQAARQVSLAYHIHGHDLPLPLAEAIVKLAVVVEAQDLSEDGAR